MKSFTFALAILFVSIWVFNFLIWDYPMSRDVWSKLNRAQTSAEADVMANYVSEAISGLTSREQIDGYCTLFFPTADNDLSVQYKTLQNILVRLERAKTFDKNSPEYQTAIDDIRGTIREIRRIDCWLIHTY